MPHPSHDHAGDPIPPSAPTTPPRAFTQGVGTVFQFVGVLMFMASMFVCCGSSLISKDAAQRHDLMQRGWTLGQDGPVYSAQRAMSLSVTLAVFFGLALAGIGLGLQAQGRVAPYGAVAVCAFGVIFWAVQLVFSVQQRHAAVLSVLVGGLFGLFALLLVLAAAALREMRRNPPPVGHEILPADYQVPYSHLHQDPPEVRLARELEQRRDRLAVQQKELEMLEERLRRKLEQRETGENLSGPRA